MTDKEHMLLMLEIMKNMEDHIGLLYNMLPLYIQFENRDDIRKSQSSYADLIDQLDRQIRGNKYENQT